MIYYYAALSIDGYMAQENTKTAVSWLDKFNEQIGGLPKDDPIYNSYFNIIKNTKVIIMGMRTYLDILSFDLPWPYDDFDSYVVTSKKDQYSNQKIKEFIDFNTLKNMIPKLEQDVFVLGGGNLAGQLIDLGLIDKIILVQMPIILGAGIRFFQNKKTFNYNLTRIEHSNNFVELEYELKK